MTTFSQMVDTMVLETRRPDLLRDIVSYLNQTIRELHFNPENGQAVFYRDNLKEDIITASVEEGLFWDIPYPQVFQQIAGCRYDSVFNLHGENIWAMEMLQPNRAMETQRYWFYRSGQRVFFKNYGGIGARISLSWYEYPKSLVYYGVDCRPCEVDEYGFKYGESFLGETADDPCRVSAQHLCTNWLLMRWATVIEEGLRAKIYKRTSDSERARTSYSMYQSLRIGLVTAESADVSGTW